MSEVEFFEALARLAEVLSLKPYGQLLEEEWPWEKNINLDISIKLESLLTLIYERINDK